MTHGTDISLAQVLDVIRSGREDWERRYGLRIAGVVGSLGRGEHRTDSDVDLLADVTGRPSLFDLHEFERELAEVIGRKTDVIVRSGLAPHWRDFAERELVAA
jgi:uncharacterized protein